MRLTAESLRTIAGTRKGFIMKASRYITFVVAVLLTLLSFSAFAQVNDTYVIPVAGYLPGALGTRWATQFSIFNPQSYDLRVSVTLIPTGGGQGTEAIVRVPGNSVAFSDNILNELFNRSGLGALLIATFPEDNPGVPNDVISRAFLVTSDTYNTDTNLGTYGQTIGGVWAGLQDFNTDGITAIAHGVRNIQRQGWRANIGAVNLGRTNVTLRVSVYDIDGNTILNKKPMNIDPLAHTQTILPVEVDRGSVEFFVDDPTKAAVVFPYVSIIDNISGDPKYQSPTLLASPSVLFGKGAVAAQALTSPGRKIDITYARGVRASADRIGERTLARTSRGDHVTQ
jgi:hypothetical protein